MAAAGAGALAAIPLSALLVGRRRLARWLAGGLVMCGAPIAAIGGAVTCQRRVVGVPKFLLQATWKAGAAATFSTD